MNFFQITYNEVMEIKDLLAFNVKKYRLEKDFTQKELAEKCGVTTHHVEDIEAGRRKPSIDLLFTLASRLGVESSELLEQPERQKAAGIMPSKVLAMYSNVPDDIVLRAKNHGRESKVWEFVRTAFDEVEAHQAKKNGNGEKKNHA